MGILIVSLLVVNQNFAGLISPARHTKLKTLNSQTTKAKTSVGILSPTIYVNPGDDIQALVEAKGDQQSSSQAKKVLYEHLKDTVITLPATNKHPASYANDVKTMSDRETKTYYVDSLSGQDTNNGRSPQTAWRTLSKIENTALFPGDTVLLARGRTWRESLTIRQSGAQRFPITIGAYGAGVNPILDGSIPLSGIQPGTIQTFSISQEPRQLMVNGQLVPRAQYPNNDFLYIDENTNDGDRNRSYLVDYDNGINNRDVIGATITIRIYGWYVESGTVTSFNGSRYNLDMFLTNGTYPIQYDYGYFLSGKDWMIDQPGEWTYNNNTRKLKIYVSAYTQSIDASVLPVGLTITGTSYSNLVSSVVIQDLTIKNFYEIGIMSLYAQDITLQNLVLENNLGKGIFLSDADLSDENPTSSRIINNTIRASNIGLWTHHCKNTAIKDNRIEDVGKLRFLPQKSTIGMDWMNNQMYGIIAGWMENSVIEQNSLNRLGYIGISFSGPNNIVRNNLVENVMLQMIDGGAIYTYGDFGSGTIVEHNIVRNVPRVIAGTPYRPEGSWSHLYNDAYPWGANGIYLDEGSNGVRVFKNTILNVGSDGLMFHQSWSHDVRENIVAGTKQYAINVMTQARPDGFNTNYHVQDNIFLNYGKNAYTNLRKRSTQTEGYFDHNKGFSPNVPYYAEIYMDDVPHRGEWHRLPEWSLLTGHELSSSDLRSVYSSIPFVMNTTASPKIRQTFNFESGLAGWHMQDQGIVTLKSSCAGLGLNGKCLEFDTLPIPADGRATVLTPLPSMQAGKGYILTFDAVADHPVSVEALYAYNGEGVYLTRQRIEQTPKKISVYFIALQTYASPNFYLRKILSANDNSHPRYHIYIDNVVLTEVSARPRDWSDDIQVYTNPQMSTQTYSLPVNQLCTLEGSPAPASVSIAPFESQVFFKCACNNDGVCNNRETKTCGDCKIKAVENVTLRQPASGNLQKTVKKK